MKKSLLIVSHAMELGGAERSLLGLLDSLNKDEWDIDLFLLRHEGELLTKIPKQINLLPEIPQYTVLARPLKDVLKEGHILLSVARTLGKLSAVCYENKHSFTDSAVRLEYSHKFTCPFMPKIQPNKMYDLAISFLTPHYYVARKVEAKKKIAWIHTDYSFIQVNRKSETKMWDAYDSVVAISDAVSKGFISAFPALKSKIVHMSNILPERLIREQAEADCQDMHKTDGAFSILSIGRFCNAKNFDNIPDICSRILDYGLSVKWYIIGFGGDEELIRRKIDESAMNDHVIILGKKSNPYPYIKNCDLYVQPSRYEGKCVTVCEAQMLGKPVVITRFPTSASQLEEDVDGCVVPLDNEGCAKGIAELLCDPNRMSYIAEVCKKRDYSNAGEAKKLSAVIG